MSADALGAVGGRARLPGGLTRAYAIATGTDAKRLYSSLVLGLVLALMTGPAGSVTAPTSGIHHALLAPRVFGFLAFGLVVWLLLTFSGRVGPRLRGVRQRVAAPARAVTAHRTVRWSWYAVLLAALILVPRLLTGAYQQLLVDQIGIYVLLALGLNIVIGFAGLLDLGYIAFFAVGAYTTAYFTGSLPAKPPFEVTPFLCFPLGVLFAMLAGVILGAPTLRLRGDYLAIVTLGFGEIIYDVANNLKQTGGPQGVAKTVPHFVFGDYHWKLANLPYWYLLLGILVAVVIGVSRLENSRTGRAWTAIREDEVAAEASGIPALRYKVMAFAFGASTSGFAGVLFASKNGFFDPGVFTEQISILILVLVIFGGMGSIWGTIVGAAVLQFLPGYFRISGSSVFQPQDIYIYVGFLLIIMMIFRPQGLIPSRRRAREIGMAEAGIGSADALAAPGSAP
ncbi:MAG TPA: branched-chain amino acid ABC transporter permease [Mycobacteriales bacterium]